MSSNLGFIVKLFASSLILAALIKYVGPVLPISSSLITVLAAILLPSMVMAGLLGWRIWSSPSP